MKNVLFIASEAVPFIKTGGLADVVGSLPKYFNKDEFDVRQNHADNLAEAEGDDRKIVAAQAKRRNADDDAEDTGDDGADDDCGKDVRNERRVITLFQERSGRCCFHEDAACIGADRHEACVPQRELPQIAGCDVQGNRQNDVDTDGD